MDADEIKAIAVAVAKQTASEIDKQRPEKCTFCTDKGLEQHKIDHEFIRQLNGFLDRLNNIRWSIIKALLQALVVAGAIGLIAFLWRTGVKGG